MQDACLNKERPLTGWGVFRWPFAVIITIMVLELKSPAYPTLRPGASVADCAGLPASYEFIATAWVASTRLAAAPVFVFAAVFVFVELAYLQFEQNERSILF